jgi:competence protein ComEA
MTLRERLDGLSRAELGGLVVVVVALLGAAGLWYVRSLPRPIEVVATPAAASPEGASPSAGAVEAVPTSVIVDVTGWVRTPGVYSFDAGARVVDAIERAGGARERADLTLLNLAAPLIDGQQVLVPKEGQAVAAVPGIVGAGGVPPGGLINVNTADAAALETLNGIGEVLASSIIQYREENGPFTSVDQLEEVSGIGPATLEKIRDHVTV